MKNLDKVSEKVSLVETDKYVDELVRHEEACLYADWYLDTMQTMREEELLQYAEAGITEREELLTLIWDSAYKAYILGRIESAYICP